MVRLLRLLTPSTKLARQPLVHLLHLPRTVKVQLIGCFFVCGTSKVVRLLRLLTPSTKP